MIKKPLLFTVTVLIVCVFAFCKPGTQKEKAGENIKPARAVSQNLEGEKDLANETFVKPEAQNNVRKSIARIRVKNGLGYFAPCAMGS